VSDLPFAPLALGPTPLVPLRRLSAHLGVEVFAKRDDLTGFELSGNKVRKLELLLGDALARGADCVLTTGGAQSNHARATALAARQLGLAPFLLLRGERPDAPDSNLLLDALAGAAIRWCSPDDYRHRRDAILASWADALRADGRRPYIIPEGGSNGLGAIAFARAAAELSAQLDGPIDRVVVAVGSGGTLAGLALGALPCPVSGVAVCDDAAYFSARVRAIAAEASALGAPPLPESGWEVVEGWQGPAYAVATPEIWETIALVARLEGLLLDPVYTGKAMHALRGEVLAGRWGGRIVFWHTGGAFGLFGRGAELPVR
jgi:D-cysteine desulfhydrase